MKHSNHRHVKVTANRFAWGLLFIALAVFLLLDACGVGFGFLEGIPFFTLALALIFLSWFLKSLFSLKLHEIFFPLAFLFMVLEKHIAGWIGAEKTNLINNWLVFLVALLLSAGVSLLRPRRLLRRVHRRSGVSSSDNHNSVGSSTVYIDCTSFTTEEVTNELGSCQVYFSNVEAYQGGGKLLLHNELGKMKVHVPKEWRIESSLKAELGALMIDDNNKNLPEDAKVITIEGMTELGAMTIVSI